MVHEEHAENLRDLIGEMLESGDVASAVGLLTNRHPADQADLIEELIMEAVDEESIDALVSALDEEQLAEMLEYLEEEFRPRVLHQLSTEMLAEVLDNLDEDIAADIVQDLPPEQAEAIVPRLEWRDSVQEILRYPEDSVGGRMSADIVKLQKDWSVATAIDFLRDEELDAEQPFYIYVVDEGGRLSGVVNLRSLVTARPSTLIRDIVNPDNVISVIATDDQEVAVERMRHYNLLAMPVVDDGNVLRGVLTADTSLDVQSEEATEDMYRMAGIGVKEWAFSPVWESAGRRVPWLAFNMVFAFLGATIISVFQGTLSQLATLAIFMPMIAGQAGNSGVQTATIVVRSMALGEMSDSDAGRVLRKEWALGLIKGIIFGGVLMVIAWIWQSHFLFGLIAGIAMFLNMLVAATTGVMLPITLRKLGIDPAAIAGVFDTMITDFMGFLIYLGLATLFLSYLK